VSELPSWNDTPTREAIVEFLGRVTEEGGPDFVPASERIATFDNDGTLWCEKPAYVQADFVLRKWRAMVDADPSLAERQPYKAIVENDGAWLGALADHVPDLVRGVGEAFGGLTTEAFEAEAVEFFETARHPTLGVPYTEAVYAPMRELLALLEASGFRVFICSAGGRDFVRPVSERIYGIPRERVIGSSAPLELRDGALVRTEGVEQPIDDGPGKPVHIWARIGRRPLLAGGNADGDMEMLAQARFALLVRHDDDAREFDYTAGAERALEAAAGNAWTVVSIRNDWNRVFA
jgi:phosphoglycolate phosphatase-like HAD superfamily hydrolase